MESRSIKTIFRLDSNEKRQILLKNVSIYPQLCVCNHFAALLKSNGSVVIKDSQKETEIFQNIKKISAGEEHILCLCFDGTVVSYGDNTYGQCDVSEWKDVTGIQAGKYNSVALTKKEELLVAGLLHSDSQMIDQPLSDYDHDIFDEMESINKKYTANNNNGDINDTQNIRTFSGNVPIIFSAPHSVRYKRNGEIRPANAYTGAMVEYLNKTYGVHGITRSGNLDDDPNGSKCKYKNVLENYINRHKIKYLFDIYGCSHEHGFDIDICTGKGRNINQQYNALPLLESSLSRLGRLSVDEYGNTAGRNYICNYIHKKTHITCIRLEMRASLRKNPAKLVSVINELGIFIKLLQKYSDTMSNTDK